MLGFDGTVQQVRSRYHLGKMSDILYKAITSILNKCEHHCVLMSEAYNVLIL